MEKWQYLDEHLRLRLADLEPGQFERFFLHFLRADISLTIERNGQKLTRRIIEAQVYNAGSGREQKGIDLLVRIGRGGNMGVSMQTPQNVERCANPHGHSKGGSISGQPLFSGCRVRSKRRRAQDEMQKHPDWTFWNLETICAEFRLRVHPSKRTDVLFFLPPEELKRFAPSSPGAHRARRSFSRNSLATTNHSVTTGSSRLGERTSGAANIY